ncbi:MAG TPA: hypothetical protein V6C96_00655, partial [Vampirovibrionales bacterium]
MSISAPALSEVLTARHPSFKTNVDGLNNAVKEISSYPGPLQKTLPYLPFPALGFLLGGSFANGIQQTIQEMLMQLTPKAAVNGVIRKSGIVVADETFVELAEYASLYFFPTVMALGLANFSTKIMPGLEHPELLGHRIYDLEKQLGKTLKVGTVKPKEIKITKELINKVAFTKTLNNSLLALAVVLAEIILTSARPIITKNVFGTDNFYKISGLQIEEDQNNDGDPAINQAWINIKTGLTTLATLIPIFLGSQFLLSKTGLKKAGLLRPFARLVDTDSRFGISRTILFPTLIIGAGIGYITTARNLAEAKEGLFRMFFFSWPSILFFKQIIGTLAVWLHGLASGAGNVISQPLKTWWNETFGKEKGKRDIFDLGFVDLHTTETTNPANPFSSFKLSLDSFEGDITGLERVQKMPKEQREQFLRRTHFIKEH